MLFAYAGQCYRGNLFRRLCGAGSARFGQDLIGLRARRPWMNFRTQYGIECPLWHSSARHPGFHVPRLPRSHIADLGYRARMPFRGSGAMEYP